MIVNIGLIKYPKEVNTFKPFKIRFDQWYLCLPLFKKTIFARINDGDIYEYKKVFRPLWFWGRIIHNTNDLIYTNEGVIRFNIEVGYDRY